MIAIVSVNSILSGDVVSVAKKVSKVIFAARVDWDGELYTVHHVYRAGGSVM